MPISLAWLRIFPASPLMMGMADGVGCGIALVDRLLLPKILDTALINLLGWGPTCGSEGDELYNIHGGRRSV